MSSPAPAPKRPYRLIAVVAIALAGIGALAFVNVKRQARAEEPVGVEGIRTVCKLATIEVALADYTRRTVPKTIDIPFTAEPEAYLFYSGVVTAGFDICDEPTKLDVDHAARIVRLSVP